MTHKARPKSFSGVGRAWCVNIETARVAPLKYR